MRVIKYPCRCESATAVALGYFDGVHTAHGEIIERVVKMKSTGLIPTVFTFSDPPGKELKGRLTTNDEKLSILESLGVEQVVLTDFECIRSLSAEEFVGTVLRDSLNAAVVACGYNYRFARNAEADAEELVRLCRDEAIAVEVAGRVDIDGVSVSSTAVRELLSEGRVSEAVRLLGREYSLEGTVVHGRRLGSAMGTPTVNLEIPEDKFVPRFGVYAAYADIGREVCKAVVNIGVKPTVADGKNKPNAEAHLLGLSRDLYGEHIRLRLRSFLRDEQRFADIAELRAAIKSDTQRAHKLL